MRKNLIGWLVLSAAVMLLLPWAAVTIVKGDGGMAAAFLLFYAVDPIYSIAAGIFAGRNVKQMWSVPIVSAVLFLLGAWALFDMGESAFLLYAGAYLALGIAAMLVCAYTGKRARR